MRVFRKKFVLPEYCDGYIGAAIREHRREIWKWYEEMDEGPRKEIIEMIRRGELNNFF